jgi:hypothetical protein
MIDSPGSQVIFVDGDNRVNYLSLSADFQPSIAFRGHAHVTEITAAAPLVSEAGFVLGLASGHMSRWDVETHGQTASWLAPSRPVSLAHAGGPTVLAGFDDGAVVLYDTRLQRRAHMLRMGSTAASPIKNVCVWPSTPVAGVGFADGLVCAIDLRAWLPLWLETSVWLRQVLPMAMDQVGMSFMALNEHEAELVARTPAWNKPAQRKSVRLRQAAFRFGMPPQGGAVLVDDVSVSFVHNFEEVPIVRLFDGRSERFQMDGNCLTDDEAAISSFHMGESLHKHPGIVTCGTRHEMGFVTADDLGFVNFWNIRASKRMY